jgi:branched-chain amino acid transport system substrate-binding protein
MKSKSLVALALGVALTASACGSSSADSGGGGGSRPTGDPIVIGVVGGYTGNQAGSQGLADDVSQAWVDWVNDKGGINGHPVDLIIKDDANDAAKGLQAVKELVEKDKVVAIVGMQSLVSSSWMDYATQQGVPVIGGTPVEASFLSQPNFFPTGTNVIAMIVGQFVRMKEAGLKKMGILYCAESPVCASLEALGKAAAGLVGGVEVAAAQKISATQPSYNAECLAMKDAGVDALFPGVQAPAVVSVSTGCDKVGYDPIEVAQATVVSTQWFDTPSLDGSLLVSPNINWLDDSNPTVKDFLGALDQFAPDVRKSPQFTINTFWSWLGGEMFRKAAEGSDIGPTSTREDVMAAMYKLKDETLGGAIAPVTYTEGQPTLLNCWFDIDQEKGTLKSASEEPTCLTADQEAGLKAILAGS